MLFKRDPHKHVHFGLDKYDTLMGQDRASLDAARRELDQCRIKVEGLAQDVSIVILLLNCFQHFTIFIYLHNILVT